MAADVNKVLRSLENCSRTKEVTGGLNELSKICAECEYDDSNYCMEEMMLDAASLIRDGYKEEIKDETDTDSM